MAGGWFPRRGRRNANGKKFNIRFFRFNTLQIATNNFSTLVGSGGFGSVYKGVLPDDGSTIAIKKFREHYEGFLEMVEMMSHLRHINLIQVIGCCTDNNQQLLVCEFAENGSVSERLHNMKAFDWETRAAVCLGIARGLSYLHHEISPPIIHRDIKPSNIVLDAHFVPKIADFDLIHFLGGSGYANVGTIHYMDPCYVINGTFSPKSDVYSFGVAMLEIITGRRPYDHLREKGEYNGLPGWLISLLKEGIPGWVSSLMKDGMVSKIVDQKLTDFPKEDVERFINVALLCTHEAPEQRPIMLDVVQMLYRRHKSDQEISDMATRVIDLFPRRNNTLGAHKSDVGSMYSLSLTTSIEARDGATSTGVHYAAEVESREEPVSAAALAPLEINLASSSKEDQSCQDDLAGAYFERSMEKIMRYHIDARRQRNDITLMTQTCTMVINKSSANKYKEAVYPPYLSGEFHRL